MQNYINPPVVAVAQAGGVGSGALGNDAVLSGNIGSGQLGRFHIASGQLAGFELGSGAIVSGRIASGQVGTGHLADGAVTSGDVGSGQITREHLNSGTVIDFVACEQAISGIRAVAWGSGGCFVVAAERTSGLRLPAIGVVAGNFVSGDVVPVVRRGIVRIAASGTIASGFPGRNLYVGSGGLIINQSGFMAGASSGEGAAPTAAGSGYSGALVQVVGISVSGGIDVWFGEPRSGLISGLLGQY